MIILGENTFYDNGYKQNANNMIIGAPGTGKSRGFVIPNLCEANNESLLVLDPKGELYNITHRMMQLKGYNLQVLDFDNPMQSPNYYNPLSFIKTQDDVIKFSNIMVSDLKENCNDNFWPLSAQILCNALTSFLLTYAPLKYQNLKSIEKLLQVAAPKEGPISPKTMLDEIMAEIPNRNAWCRSQYMLVRNAADKTIKCIIVSLAAEFCGLLSKGIVKLTSKNTIDPKSFCEKKTIIYVKCSDTDRSKDKLVGLFFTQFLQEIYAIADKSCNHSLSRPVHIILDDMGANLKIPSLDCMIATSRGRDISFSLILQSFGQLKKNYVDYMSIISSCNNLVFLGSNDVETCKDIATRLNRPLNEILYKNKRDIFVFQQGGQEPIITKVYDLIQHPKYKWLSNPYTNSEIKEIYGSNNCAI